MKDFREVSWDFMPPEQHFTSPGALKQSILHYQSTRLQGWQKSQEYLNRLGKFEAIENRDGSFTLWPCTLDYGFLFRGQGEFHVNCAPTLFRSKLSDEQLFLERLRLTEFELLAKQYPSVDFFKQQNITIDYLGLAQHYLLKTEVLDLTSDIDVAMFFAMCDFDWENDCYHSKIENQEYIGYIYVYPLAQNILVGGNLEISFDKVKPIGLQPFKRPGEQCGYALHMKSGETFKGTIYSFSYTKQDSEHILEYFKEKRPLFFKDEFSTKIRSIIKSNIFSISALRLAASRWSKSVYGKKKTSFFCQKKMNGLGIHFKDNPMPWDLTDKEINNQISLFNESGQQKIQDSIVKFGTISGGIPLPYRTVDLFSRDLILNMYVGGCPSLPGYNSEFTLSYEEANKMTTIGYNYGRELTVPNPHTGKIDKWDNLPWDKYPNVTIEDHQK